MLEVLFTNTKPETRESLLVIINNEGNAHEILSSVSIVYRKLKLISDEDTNDPCEVLTPNAPAGHLNGAMTRIMKRRSHVLIVTDAFIRTMLNSNISLPDFKHVISYDLPKRFDVYEERLPTVGRYSKKGTIYTLLGRNEDTEVIEGIIEVSRSLHAKPPIDAA